MARAGAVDPGVHTTLGLHHSNAPGLPPTPLLCDNKASTFTANNPSSSPKKHIELRHLKVREYVSNGEIRVLHVRTDYNVSDFFTKGLTIKKFSHFRELIMGDQPQRKKPPPPVDAGGAGG